MNAVISLINSILTLAGRNIMTHFPSTADVNETWQYDEYDDEDWGKIGGLTIQVGAYTSMAHKAAVWCLVEYMDGDIDVAFNLSEHLDEWGDEETKAILTKAAIRRS